MRLQRHHQHVHPFQALLPKCSTPIARGPFDHVIAAIKASRRILAASAERTFLPPIITAFCFRVCMDVGGDWVNAADGEVRPYVIACDRSCFTRCECRKVLVDVGYYVATFPTAMC